MKIRTGFVSNSSSSSFIIRGMEVSTEEIRNGIFGGNPKIRVETRVDDGVTVVEEVWIPGYSVDGIAVRANDNPFYRVGKTPSFIFGEEIAHMEDGDVVVIEDRTKEQDEDLAKRLTSLLGITCSVDLLKTYAHYLSNDNY